ncbi:LOW QUALITY PROTEIN: hypothetical protein CFOL_v3_26628, partial [Cephalotus follicularis]
KPMRISSLRGNQYMEETLAGLTQVCHEMLRMHKSTFLYFCEVLRKEGGLENTSKLMVEEQVAMFLIAVGKNWDQRSIVIVFNSLWRRLIHVRRVIRTVTKLAKYIVRPSTEDDAPFHIKSNKKYYPWFKKCVRAINRTHVSVSAPVEKYVNFRDKKSTVTQNVMCACNFNMEFMLVYSGWEDTTIDSRVFLDALTR